jgi:hypothetical protein
MATKIKLMKLLQEIRGFADLSRHNFNPRPSPLYLLQLRSHLAETSRSKYRLTISVDLKDTLSLPHPVKITHLQPVTRGVVPARQADPVSA